MKGYPILMSGPMVRATLDDGKSQTRRIVKPQPPDGYRPFIIPDASDGIAMWAVAAGEIGNETSDVAVRRCPYGGVGSILWVRETFVIESNHYTASVNEYPPPFTDGRPTNWHTGNEDGDWWEQCHYRATDPDPALHYGDLEDPHCRWRPSIFMPRWASRLTLEITQVRAERLCDITEEDAQSEGAEREFRTVVMDPRGLRDYHIPNSYRGGFANLWEEIYGKKYPWASSPWVWAITYKRIRP